MHYAPPPEYEALHRQKIEDTLLACENIGLDPNDPHLHAIAQRVADEVVKKKVFGEVQRLHRTTS